MRKEGSLNGDSFEDENEEERLNYLSKLFGVSRFKINLLKKKGMSFEEIESRLEYQSYEDLIKE
jgi:hypothetical protein